MVKPVTVRAENELALERPPYGFAGLVALLLLVLYVATIGPTTQFWDTSEYIAAAKGPGHTSPAGQPAVRTPGKRVGHAADRGKLRAAYQSPGRNHQRVGVWLPVSRGRPIPPRHDGRAPMGSPGDGVRGCLRRRHVLHRLEPVDGEREGVHGQPAVDRARPVDHRALGRRHAPGRTATAGSCSSGIC